MNGTLIYSKTPKGVAEIGNRGGGLSMAVRRVLIMTDGKRSVSELQAMLGTSDVGDILAMLAELGHVRLTGGSIVAPTTSRNGRPPTNSPAALPGTPMTAPMTRAAVGMIDGVTQAGRGEERLLLPLEEVRRRAVRELTDRLGPLAESIALRIEQCRTAEELRTCIREAERMLAGMLGEAAAADYMRALRRR